LIHTIAIAMNDDVGGVVRPLRDQSDHEGFDRQAPAAAQPSRPATSGTAPRRMDVG
jgi:hypothetical protein